MKRLIVFSTIFLMLLIATNIHAQKHAGRGCGVGDGPNGCCPGRMADENAYRPGILLRMADEIGLDANQKIQIAKMNEEHALLRIDKEAELEKAELRLHHLMNSDGAEKEVLAAMDKVGALKSDLKKMQYQHRNSVKALLDVDQLKRLKEIRQSRGSGDAFNCPGDGPRRGQRRNFGSGTQGDNTGDSPNNGN